MRTEGWLKRHHKICALINQLQLEEATWRESMKECTGKTSRADLTEINQVIFIHKLEAMLPHDKGRPRGPLDKHGNHIQMITPEQKKLIEDIFITSLGWHPMQLNAFIMRMTKDKATSVGTLIRWAAANIIEAGKNMQKRKSIKGDDGQYSGESQTRA